MTSTLMTGARTTVAVAAAALLLVAGCDDGTDQSAPPEAPAEQETQAAGDESTGSEEDAAGDEASAGEESAGTEEDTGADDEQDTEDTSDDGSAEPISGDPCADLTSEDVGAVLGGEVGDRENDASQELPEGADSENMVICAYPADDGQVPSAALQWIMPFDGYPDEMPEEVREEQEENRTSSMIGDGEEIDVAGASQARVEVVTGALTTSVTVRAAVGGAVLWSSITAEPGALDESDIPTAVELAELAISKA